MLSDPRSSRVRQARRLARRAFRQDSGRILVEGPQAVREAARAGFVIELFVTPSAVDRFPEIMHALPATARVSACSDEVLGTLAETLTPQGVVAVCRTPVVSLDQAVERGVRLAAVLVEVGDPGNAGTVIRCADAAGADAVVLTQASVDPTNGKCVRASAGSLFHLPVAAHPPLSEVVARLRALGCVVLATGGGGELDLDAAADAFLLDGPTAWLYGSEAHGLSPAATALADHVVRIPIHGRAESLNLASAAAVTLYASARCQRRTRG